MEGAQIDLLSYVASDPERPAAPVVRRRLLLIDGNNLACRAWYGSGRYPPVEAFTGHLVRLARMVEPDQAIVVFDGDGPSWRHELWPEYKGTRKPKPDGLAEHIVGCRAASRHVRFATAWIDATEADDLLASYTADAVRAGWSTTIVTSDHDLMQLVQDDPAVLVLDPGPDAKRWDSAAIVDRFGVAPRHIADLKSLTGDTSDNYPGVPKIGPVTAVKLIADHGCIESILDRVNLISSKRTRELLEQGTELAITCKRLAKLVDDLPLPIPLK